MRAVTALLLGLAVSSAAASLLGAAAPRAAQAQAWGVGRARQGRCANVALRLRGGEDDVKQQALQEKEEGNKLFQKLDFTGALEHYNKAHELDPTNMVYVNNIASAHYNMGNCEDAAQYATKAIEIGKENRAPFQDIAKAYARLANAQWRLGNLDEALKSFDKSLMEHKDGKVALRRKDCAREKQEAEEKAYQDPAKAEEERALGNAAFKEGKWVDAIKHYTEGIKRDPNNHLCYSNRGQTFIKVLDLGSALKDCDKCIELAPTFPRAYARKATVQLLCKQAHKAKETIEIGTKMCPDDAEIRQVAQKVQAAIMGVGLSPEEREARAQEAMKDPQIVNIMQDPIMRDVLNEMQTNPASAQKHMQNPEVARKVEMLIAAGIIQTR